MRVVTPAGETVELGSVETGATIGITDYSRRATDDFGVTTVVPRGFARRMSLRLAVPSDAADGLQRRLADLRATSALWIADDRFASLQMQGFYKDFRLDMAAGSTSYSTLSVESLVVPEPGADGGADPAAGGHASTFRLLQPTTVTDTLLVSSNVVEDAGTEWSSGTTYGLGARVIKAATHRIYESLTAGNLGNDPAGASGKWLDTGPTNRWAMFDEALGTITATSGPIVVTLAAGAGNAVALLDVRGDAVRVQATGYDRTLSVGPAALTFLDLPASAGQITVRISGSGTVSVGTLMVGRVVGLGSTETAPSAGITDYSRKVVDDFGDVTIVERAWSKTMTARTLIRTDAVDLVADRIAAVRARPSLWIGQEGVDSLTIWGFFKDFSVAVDHNVSILSLSIEGLSKAAAVAPLAVQGPPGKDGAPGQNGINGQTLYTWVAYSDAPDGTVNFTTGAPGARGYQGLAVNRTTAAESANPADYSWAPYRGPALFGLVARGNCVVGPDYALKAGGAGEWDSDVYSDVRWTGGCQLSFRPGQNNRAVLMGINTDPATNPDFQSVDYAFYLNWDGQWGIRESGVAVNLGGATPYDPSTIFQIKYDGRSVSYYVAGSLFRTVPTAANRSFYLDSSFADPGGRIDQISWAAMGAAGSDGNDGTDGAPGQNGVDGQTLYTWVAYSDAPDGSLNFTTGAPGARGYQGLSVNRPSPTESTNPADYVWAAYRGPALFGLVARGNCVVGPDYALKNGGAGAWDSDVYSDVRWTGGCQLSFRPGQANRAVMMGINTDPTTNTDFTSIDYAFELGSGGQWGIRENGGAVALGGSTPYDASTIFQIKYDGRAVSYFVAGSLFRSVPTTAGRSFYLDSSFQHPGARIDQIAWAAMGAAGSDGNDGAPGADGEDGAPGVNAIGVAIAPAVITIACDAAGTPKDGQFPRTAQVSVTSGTVDATNASSYSLTALGCYATMTATGVVTVNGIVNDQAYVDISASYAGGTTKQRLTLSKVRDAMANQATRFAAGPAQVSDANYGSSNFGPAEIIVGPGGVMRASLDATYPAGVASTMAAKLQYREKGTGTWIDFQGETIGEASTVNRPGEPGNPGQVVIRTSAAAPSDLKVYQFQAVVRRQAGSANDVSIVLYAAWSPS